VRHCIQGLFDREVDDSLVMRYSSVMLARHAAPVECGGLLVCLRKVEGDADADADADCLERREQSVCIGSGTALQWC
jgi:hypothetical protein